MPFDQEKRFAGSASGQAKRRANATSIARANHRKDGADAGSARSDRLNVSPVSRRPARADLLAQERDLLREFLRALGEIRENE